MTNLNLAWLFGFGFERERERERTSDFVTARFSSSQSYDDGCQFVFVHKFSTSPSCSFVSSRVCYDYDLTSGLHKQVRDQP